MAGYLRFIHHVPQPIVVKNPAEQLDLPEWILQGCSAQALLGRVGVDLRKTPATLPPDRKHTKTLPPDRKVDPLTQLLSAPRPPGHVVPPVKKSNHLISHPKGMGKYVLVFG